MPGMNEDDSRRRRKESGDADLKPSSDTASQRRKETAPSGAGRDKVLPDAGIRSMGERLEYLRAELAKWTAAQKRYPARADDMNRRITELKAAIADTQDCLTEYRTRRDGSI
jgi:hypothetical protein